MAAGTEIGRGIIPVGYDVDERELGRVLSRSAESADSDGIGKSIGRRIAGGIAATFAAVGVVNLVRGSIGAASDLNEEISKSGVVFGDSAKGIQDWAKGTATSLGQSQKQALEAAGTFGNLFRTIGIGTAPAADMSKSLVGLASDLASFNNASPAEVLDAIRSGLVGEAEPLRKYGVLLDDASLRQEALKLGLIKTTKDALTPAMKAQAAYAAIVDQTGTAQGDFARTSDGLANRQRILAAQFEDVKAKVGGALLPAFLAITTFVSKNMGPVFNEISGAIRALVASFKAGDGDITSNGLAGIMEHVGFIARQVVDFVVANWPKIQATIAAVASAVGAALSFLISDVLPVLITGVQTMVLWVVEHWPEIQATIAGVVVWLQTNVVPVIQEVMAFIVAKFAEVVAWAQEKWPAIQEAIGHVIVAIETVIRATLDVIQKAWDEWGSHILDAVGSVWGAIKAIITAAIKVVQGVISLVVDLINGDWGKAWNDALGIVSAVWDGILGVIGGAVGAVVALVSGLASSLYDAMKAAGSKLLEGLEAGLSAVGGFAGRVADAIVGAVRSAWNSVAGTLNDLLPNSIGSGPFSIDLPDNPIPTFHTGGVVPGRPGEEVLVLAKAGERITTANQFSGTTSTGGHSFTYVDQGSGRADPAHVMAAWRAMAELASV